MNSYYVCKTRSDMYKLNWVINDNVNIFDPSHVQNKMCVSTYQAMDLLLILLQSSIVDNATVSHQSL